MNDAKRRQAVEATVDSGVAKMKSYVPPSDFLHPVHVARSMDGMCSGDGDVREWKDGE